MIYFDKSSRIEQEESIMEEINTGPKFKAGDIVEVDDCAPKCMFRGIQYTVTSVKPKDRPMCSFVPDNESCKTCDKTKKCPAINTDDAVLNSWTTQLEGAKGEIDALYLKKAE